MKRIAVLAIALAFVALGPARAGEPTPAATVHAFYAWYFGALKTRDGWSGHLAGARAYLTPSLYQLLAKTVAVQNAAHAEVLDADPFADAQEHPKSFSVGTPGAGSTVVNVPVTLAFAGGHGTFVAVVRNGGDWRIDNLLYGSGGNLRATLTQALK